MYFAYAQRYDNYTSTLKQEIEPLLHSPVSASYTLNTAAKNFIIREQGTLRAEEPIRTLEELKTNLYKLEKKGYYLVSLDTSKCIDVYELLIGEKGYVFTANHSLIPYKKISVSFFPSANSDSTSNIPEAPEITNDIDSLKEYKVIKSGVSASVHSKEPTYGLTPEILSTKISSLRRVNSEENASSPLFLALEPKGSSEFQKMICSVKLRHVEKLEPIELSSI